MNVYVFGNQDLCSDDNAIKIAKKIEEKNKDINFIYLKPNQDIKTEKELIIMDVVKGIETVKILDENHIDKLINAPRYSAHDFDLSFQLKYLKKLDKIDRVTIIGLPMITNDEIISRVSKILTNLKGK